MSENQMKQIIRSLAEQKAPESSIDLWPGIKSQVSDPNRRRSLKLRFAVATLALTILLAGVVFFLTPQGQAWAQNAFQFFSKIESDRMPFESYNATVRASSVEESTQTVDQDSQDELTQVAESTSTSDSISQGTTIQDDATPIPDQDDQALEELTLEEVQALVDFQIYQPTWLPEKFAFEKAVYDKESNIVTLEYYRSGNIVNAFGLRQTPLSSSESCELCSLVGANAHVLEVSINGVYGEYVRGVWTAEEGYATWENNWWMQRVKWHDCGMAFELNYMGDPGYLTKSDIIAIAESIQ